MIIDTHSHVQFPAYDNDRYALIKKTLAENIWMINVGTSYQTSLQAVELAEKYESGVYAAIGLHPTDVDEPLELEKYRQLAQSKKVVAIGEIGLDYFRPPFDKVIQKEVFLQQLDLAKELNLPVILHCRMAHQDVIDVLKSQIPIPNSQLRGVVHCFTGSVEEMRQYVALGFHIGLNGIMFKLNLDDVVKNVPVENMLVETDCPYLTPPMAESKRNEPLFIKHTIQKIAKLKNISAEQVADVTTQNARKLFNI